MSDRPDEFPAERVAEVASATPFVENVRRVPYALDRRLAERLDWYISTPNLRRSDLAAVEMTVLPPLEFVSDGFPIEQVRIFGSEQHPWVQLLGGVGRRWLHVYRPFGLLVLCLWTESDPPDLVWHTDDGWHEFLRIVQRHLVYEEYARRNDGKWPIEDAHGPPEDNDPLTTPPPTTQILAAGRSWNN